MKTFIIFYSRTGTTGKVAKDMAKNLKCDIEEIKDFKSRAGVLGFMMSGKEAGLKQLPEIKKPAKNPKLYDVIIIGTPVWAFTMSSPVRTYIHNNKKYFKKIALFCTHEGGPGNTLKDMEKLCGMKAAASIDFNRKDVESGRYAEKLRQFIIKLKW
jgi:flavodoxin